MGTEQVGVQELRRRLALAGRTVDLSARKTFDLVIDGRFAEVKVKGSPLRTMDFIGLTEAQQTALAVGEDFVLIIVANVSQADPNLFEIVEIEAADLRELSPKAESTHFYYGSWLRKIGSRSL